jgi:hypothetical protein
MPLIQPKKNPPPIVTYLLFGTLALAIIFYFANIPPVPQFIELQAQMLDNKYFAKVTILITWIVFAIPALGIYFFIKINQPPSEDE